MHILFNSLLGKASSALHGQTPHITVNVLRWRGARLPSASVHHADGAVAPLTANNYVRAEGGGAQRQACGLVCGRLALVTRCLVPPVKDWNHFNIHYRSPCWLECDFWPFISDPFCSFNFPLRQTNTDALNICLSMIISCCTEKPNKYKKDELWPQKDQTHY